MTARKAGEPIEYVITYLEMTHRPAWDYPNQPLMLKAASLIHADAPPPWYFLALYDAVGNTYEWTDTHDWSEDDLKSWLSAPSLQLYTLMGEGWPKGFFVLDTKDPASVDLAYFGLVPEAIGQGFGTWFLRTAILMAWDLPDITRLTVNTNTLDHPRALAQYQKAGFTAYAQETKTRILTRDRNTVAPN